MRILANPFLSYSYIINKETRSMHFYELRVFRPGTKKGTDTSLQGRKMGLLSTWRSMIEKDSASS
jgi:hypothetical protein